MSRRTIFTDEYRYESVDETTIRYIRPRTPSPPPPPPPKPVTTTTTTTIETTYYRPVTPPPPPPPKPVTTTTTTVVTTSHKPELTAYTTSISPRVSRIGTTTLYRSPSLRTVRFNSIPRVTYIPPVCHHDNVVNIQIEKENTPVKTITTNEYSEFKQDFKYDYSFNETFESKKSRSKSMTRLNDSYELQKIDLNRHKPNSDINSVTVIYDQSLKNDDRHVHFCEHLEQDNCCSLAGSLIKANASLLPVNRSVEIGSIFNGNSFGILSKHIEIKDTFDLSFDFRTSSKNGILAILSDTYSSDCFFIELYDSQLKATLYIDGEPDSCWTEFETPVLSDYLWNSVNVKLVGNRLTMHCRNNFYTKNHRRFLRMPIRGDLFVAGHPAIISPPYVCRSKDFFCGEMRNFYVNHNGIKWYGVPTLISPRLKNWYD